MEDKDCAQSFEESKVKIEMIHKDTDVITDRSNSNSSCTSDLSQDSAVSSIYQSDPPAPQPKVEAVESVGTVQTMENSSLSRIQSSSRGSQIRLSGVLGNHDPNRIPVSIFSGRPSNPMEWSTASNESLFSIHVGNTSFSREHFNFLTKSGELMMNPNSSPNLPNFSPFVEPARAESKTEIMANVSVEPVTLARHQIPAISTQSVAEDHRKVVTQMDDIGGRHSVSNDSMNSSCSFQFPLLGGEGATPKATSFISTDSDETQRQHPVMKLESLKKPSMKQQLPEDQSPSHETTATAAPPPAANSGSGWFSCLSWCRRC